MSSASTRKVIPMREVCILIALLLAVALCVPTAAQQAAEDMTKSVIVTLHYKDGTVTPVGSRVVYGPPPDNLANSDMLVNLVGKNDAVIGSYGIEDPRVMYFDNGAVLESDVQFTVILPFDATAGRVDLFDGATKEKLASADVTGAVSQFCASHTEDPDCGGSAIPVIVYGAAALVILIAGAVVYFVLKRRTGSGSQESR